MHEFSFDRRSPSLRAAAVALTTAIAAAGFSQTHPRTSATVNVALEVASYASLSVSATPSAATVSPVIALYLKNDGTGKMVRDTTVQTEAPTFKVYCWANKNATLSAEVADGRATFENDEEVHVPIVFGWPVGPSVSIPARSIHLEQTLTLDVATDAAYPGGGGSSATDADGLYNALVTVTIATE